MSDTLESNDNFSVAADALVGNIIQQEPLSFLPSNEKVEDNNQKVVSKTQKPLKMKSENDVSAPETNNVASAAENDNSVAGVGNTSINSVSDNLSNSATPLNSSNYFGNRSNPNINSAKKSFEKRYNSISFSPNVNLHSSILNSSPILKPKKTLHVTNFTMNKCALRNLLLSFSGFKTVAFYQDYCFVVFADIESATAAAEQLLAKTKLKVNFSKADYIPNVVSPSSIGNPNSILHVTNYPTSTTEAEMIEMYSSYPGYLHIHFSKNFSLVYYQDIVSAKNVLQHMNQTTNFTTIYSIKNANNSPINMNNNYHNNVPNGPPPFNPLMNNGYRGMGVNNGLVMANGYPPPPVATTPATSNFNANGVINHSHNTGPNAVNVSQNNSFIKYNNSNTNLSGLTNVPNTKNLNGLSVHPNGASNNSNNVYGYNNVNSTATLQNNPLKMNSTSALPNTTGNGINYYGGLSKPMSLSQNYGKNPNDITRKHSEGADLSTQLLNLNLSNGNEKNDDNSIHDMIKSSLVQSKSETNISGLMNRKGSTPLMSTFESTKNTNNVSSNSNASSPFFKKSSIYDDVNGLKPSNSSQLLSAGNFGMDRNDFLSSRKHSNASSVLVENGQNSNVGLVNTFYDNNNPNYSNGKFMMAPDISFSSDYGKNSGYNSMMPLQNYNNYPESNSQQSSNNDGKVNISDPISKDIFNPMNFSNINDPDSIFNNLNRTLSDSAINQNKLFEGDNDAANTSLNLNSSDKIHPSLAISHSTNVLNNNLHQGSNTSAFNITNANSEKLSFMPLTMGGHGSVLPNTHNDTIRNSLKQNSLSSIDLMKMTNLYNSPINSSTFSNPLMKTSKNELPFISNIRSNSASPYVDINNNNNNLLSAGMTNTSFSSMNGIPSLLNKSRSFCAINSLNKDNNQNPNDLSFNSIFSSDKKDSNSSLDGGVTLINNRYGVESPKSMYEPGLKNFRVNDSNYEGNASEVNKSVGVIGDNSAKATEKMNETFENDYNLKINNNFSNKDISSSFSDSSINENDFIEFIASKRSETSNDKTTLSNNNIELEAKEMNNTTSQKSSLSSVTSPTIIYSPTYNEKSELSMDEVINFTANGKVSSSSSSSTTQINSKINNLSYSTLVNNNANESFQNSTTAKNSVNPSSKVLSNELGLEDNKENDDLIKQLYSKIEQLQKENNELSQTREYHLCLISKLENQLEITRNENNNLKEQLNRI